MRYEVVLQFDIDGTEYVFVSVRTRAKAEKAQLKMVAQTVDNLVGHMQGEDEIDGFIDKPNAITVVVHGRGRYISKTILIREVASKAYTGPVKVFAWDGGTRYLVAPEDKVGELEPAIIVDTSDGLVSPPIRLGSILVQGQPDQWREESGPEAERALALVSR